MKLIIECEEEQAQIMINALEDYFRLRMGQELHMADSLARDTFKYNVDDPNNEKKFDEYIIRRENLECVYRSLIDVAYGRYGYRKASTTTDDCRNASDIWSCLRHSIYVEDLARGKVEKEYYDVRGQEPIRMGTLPLMKVEVKYE